MVADPDRHVRYELDCRPVCAADGRFRPRLVVRHADTHEVLARAALEAGPYAEASDAVEVAYIAGCGWVRMCGQNGPPGPAKAPSPPRRP